MALNPRQYGLRHYEPPTEAEVLAAVVRLAGQPRPLIHGRGVLALPGPTASDVGRSIGRYAEAVRPVLAALCDQGRLTSHRIGAARCYVLADESRRTA